MLFRLSFSDHDTSLELNGVDDSVTYHHHTSTNNKRHLHHIIQGMSAKKYLLSYRIMIGYEWMYLSLQSDVQIHC